MLWLVLGMALFRNEPIEEVARRLNICSKGLASEQLMAKSGVSQARQRLGSHPMQWLFKRTGQHWANERFNQDDWQGLQAFAIDGVIFRTADTPELQEHFGGDSNATIKQSPYPLLRCVALMNTHSHIILKVSQGLCLLPCQQIPIQPSQLLNYIDSVGKLSLGIRDIKSSMLSNAVTLRSKKVDLVYQELWGMLLAYNIVRQEACHAAAIYGQRASDIRFKMAFSYIASNLIVMAAAKPESKTGMRLQELRAGICNLFLDRKKARPSRPRMVKQSRTRYPVYRNAVVLN